jgi:hypothetical protein
VALVEQLEAPVAWDWQAMGKSPLN